MGAEGDHSPPAPFLPFFCVSSAGSVRADSPSSTRRVHPALFGCFALHTLPHVGQWSWLRSSPFPRAARVCQEMGTIGQRPFHPPNPPCFWKCESLPDCEKSQHSEKPPQPCTADARGFRAGTSLPSAPTTPIWNRSQGVREIDGKHRSANRAPVCRPPMLMLERLGGADVGGQSGWHRQLLGLPLEKVRLHLPGSCWWWQTPAL